MVGEGVTAAAAPAEEGQFPPDFTWAAVGITEEEEEVRSSSWVTSSSARCAKCHGHVIIENLRALMVMMTSMLSDLRRNVKDCYCIGARSIQYLVKEYLDMSVWYT